ncbi:MAG: peptidoglycan-binding protein [Acidobacteria bacterium]|nr:peptidoglycan-binding protein [Acidobacteriota bacterium]
MRTALLLALALLGWAVFGAQTGTKSKTKSTSKQATSSKKPGSKSTTKPGSSRKGKAAPRRYGQIEPTPDRYREIQQALIDRGYLKSGPTGKWDGESMDAMRRFQQDQNLEASGKLDSLSLIALGLGPKRTNAQARPQ